MIVVLKKPARSADVHARAPERIRLGLTQHFAGDGCSIAFAERQELQQVGNRVSLRPSEIDVRYFARSIADIQQQRGDGVWNGGALTSQHAVGPDTRAFDGQQLAEL